MTGFTLFLITVSTTLLIAVIVVLVWSLNREQHFERQLQRKEADHAEALRRQGELSAQITGLQGEQVRQAQQLRRTEERLRRRGELIQDLGLDPDRLEQVRDGLHGVDVVLRLRVGIVIVAALNRLHLEETAQQTSARAEALCRQLSARLGSGEGGAHQQDQRARDAIEQIIDDRHMDQPVGQHGDGEWIP